MGFFEKNLPQTFEINPSWMTLVKNGSNKPSRFFEFRSNLRISKVVVFDIYQKLRSDLIKDPFQLIPGSNWGHKPLCRVEALEAKDFSRTSPSPISVAWLVADQRTSKMRSCVGFCKMFFAPKIVTKDQLEICSMVPPSSDVPFSKEKFIGSLVEALIPHTSSRVPSFQPRYRVSPKHRSTLGSAKSWSWTFGCWAGIVSEFIWDNHLLTFLELPCLVFWLSHFLNLLSDHRSFGPKKYISPNAFLDTSRIQRAPKNQLFPGQESKKHCSPVPTICQDITEKNRIQTCQILKTTTGPGPCFNFQLSFCRLPKVNGE